MEERLLGGDAGEVSRNPSSGSLFGAEEPNLSLRTQVATEKYEADMTLQPSGLETPGSVQLSKSLALTHGNGSAFCLMLVARQKGHCSEATPCPSSIPFP